MRYEMTTEKLIVKLLEADKPNRKQYFVDNICPKNKIKQNMNEKNIWIF